MGFHFATTRALVAVALVAGLLGVPARAYADGGAWPAFHGNNQHTGFAGVTGPRALTLAWYTGFPDDVDASPAIGADGTIYITATDGSIAALNPDGGQKWAFNAGARVYASPVLGTNGLVIVGDVRGRVRGINANDGTISWTATGLGSVRGTAVVGADGTAYLGNDAGQLLGIAADGKEKFRTNAAQAAIVGAPAIAPSGALFFGALDQKLRRATPAGDVQWTLPLDGPIASAPAIGSDGTIYAGAGGNLVAIDPEAATVKWSMGLGGDVMTTPAIGPDGTIYAGSEGGALVAVSPAGAVRWRVQTGGAVRSSPAVGANGAVYFGSGDGLVYAVDANGERLSNFRALDAVHGAVALGSDGTVFVGARDNRLYALKDNIRPFVQAPADRLSGDLVRDPSTGKVYVIVDGQRRYIPDPGTQLLLGLAGPLPTNLNASELARFPEGPALPSLGEGSVLRSSNGVVYAIRNGQRAWIHNLDEFAAGNYRWEAVVAVEDRIVRTIPLALESGMLLRGAGDRVYLYDGSQRQWITTADAFAARGYTWSQVHFVSDATLQAIPEGAQLS